MKNEFEIPSLPSQWHIYISSQVIPTMYHWIKQLLAKKRGLRQRREATSNRNHAWSHETRYGYGNAKNANKSVLNWKIYHNYTNLKSTGISFPHDASNNPLETGRGMFTTVTCHRILSVMFPTRYSYLRRDLFFAGPWFDSF